MLSDCRQFQTSVMTGSHKLLIVQGRATVAVSRQGRQEVDETEKDFPKFAKHCFDAYRQRQGNHQIEWQI